MRGKTAPNSVQPGRCGFLTYHIGTWVETAQLETAPTIRAMPPVGAVGNRTGHCSEITELKN